MLACNRFFNLLWQCGRISVLMHFFWFCRGPIDSLVLAEEFYSENEWPSWHDKCIIGKDIQRQERNTYPGSPCLFLFVQIANGVSPYSISSLTYTFF